MDAHEAFDGAVAETAAHALASAHLVREAYELAEVVEVSLGAGLSGDSPVVVTNFLTFVETWQLQAMRTSLSDLIAQARAAAEEEPISAPPIIGPSGINLPWIPALGVSLHKPGITSTAEQSDGNVVDYAWNCRPISPRSKMPKIEMQKNKGLRHNANDSDASLASKLLDWTPVAQSAAPVLNVLALAPS